MAYTWTRTRGQARDMVLRKLGVLGAGETATAEDASLVYEAMDARLKELHALGILWWNVNGEQTALALVAGEGTVTIEAADYLFPVSMMLVSGQRQQSVEIIGHQQYQAIEDKTQQGEPGQVFIEGAICRFWPVPRANGEAMLTYQAIAEDTEGVLPTDIPVSMLRAFVDVIAGDLTSEFQIGEPRASRLIGLQDPAIRTIRALNQERIATAPLTPEYF